MLREENEVHRDMFRGGRNRGDVKIVRLEKTWLLIVTGLAPKRFDIQNGAHVIRNEDFNVDTSPLPEELRKEF